MLVKAISKGFYNKAIVDVNDIFDYDKGELPDWVTPVKDNKSASSEAKDKVETKSLKVSELPEDKKADIIKRANDVGIKGNLAIYCVDTLEKKILEQNTIEENDTKLLEELETLRTEALDKNIVIDIENKSVVEQISELKNALGKV